VDLADMGQKLNAAATAAADTVHRKIQTGEKPTPEELKQGPLLYELAADTGPAPPQRVARSAFLAGVAALREGNAQVAETKFAEASHAEPSNPDYTFYRALSVYQTGNKAGALRSLEADLPDDPRTGVLKLELAFGYSPQAGAEELERLLFKQRAAK
jgi:hypothetical protein